MVTYIPISNYLDFSHMYNFIDRSSSDKKICLQKNSIYDIINSEKNFSEFRKIIDQSNLQGIFNDPQLNSTIFIFENENIPQNYFDGIDIGTCRNILNFLSISNIIDKKLLTSSPFFYLSTKNSKIFVENKNNETILNHYSKIKKFDIKASNGMIHIIDNILLLDQINYQ